MEIETERATQEAQEETDDQDKVKEQVGTGAGSTAQIRRIVVNSTSKTQKENIR